MAQGRIFHRFVAFQKVDEDLREVWGDATVEEIDKQKEIVRFPGAVKAFDAQDIYFTKASKGKSKGNVRSMHQPIAAGRVIAWEADEKRKAIPIGTKIDDDAEWAKAKAGTYIGFSIGGEVTKEHKETIDGQEINIIDEFDLIEVSLVDHPACPSAVFSVVKVAAADPAPLAPAAPLAPETPAPEVKAEKTPSSVQTLIFDKKKFDAAAAKKWASDLGFKSRTVDETDDSIRIRQRDPGDFKEDSVRTIELKDGVKAEVGHPKMDTGRFGKILKALGNSFAKRSESMSIMPILCALHDLQNALDSEAFEMAMGEDMAQEKADIGLLGDAVEALLEFLGSEFQQEVRSYLAAEAGADGRPMYFLDWAETVSKALTPLQLEKVLGDDDMKKNLEAIHRMGHGLVTASGVMGSGCPDKVCKEEDAEDDAEEEDTAEGDGDGEGDGEGEDAGAAGESEGDGEEDDGEGEDDGEEEEGKGKKVATLTPARVIPVPAAAATPRKSTGKKILKSLAKVQEQLGSIRTSVDSMDTRVKSLEELPTAIGRPPAVPHEKQIPGVDGPAGIVDPLALLRKRAEEETDPVRKQTLTLILTEETIKLQQAGVRVG
jgi:hypothetical protein